MIYKVRPRGQVVNEACQWIVEHHRLVISLAVKPIAYLAAYELFNLIFFQSVWQSLLVMLIAALLVPVLPSMVMYVVENPEEFDYPNRLPKLMELKSLWRKYFRKALIIYILGSIAQVLLSITFVGSFIITLIMPLAIVISHRNDDIGYFSAYTKAIDYSFTNFVNAILVLLGVIIIFVSMALGPFSVLFLGYWFINEFIAPWMIEIIVKYVKVNDLESVILFVPVVGSIYACMTSLIITHFFYGHCVRKIEEKNALKVGSIN